MTVPLVEANVLCTAGVVSLRFVLGITALPASRVLMKSPKEKSMRQFDEFAVQTQFRQQIDVGGHISCPTAASAAGEPS